MQLTSVTQVTSVAPAAIIAVVVTFLSSNQAAAATISSFHIGNSLTSDAHVENLPGDTGWHLRGGTSLGQHARPDLYQPDAASPSYWDVALVNQQYDLITIQPHGGYLTHESRFNEISDDVAFIRNIRALQPTATIAIYETWPMLNTTQQGFVNWDNDPGGNTTWRNRVYWDRLSTELSDVAHIRLQVGQMTVDFSDPTVLYSPDGNHFEPGSGEYLAEAAFLYLKTGTLPPDSQAFNLTSSQLAEAKNLVMSRIIPVSAVPEPSAAAIGLLACLGVLFRRVR